MNLSNRLTFSIFSVLLITALALNKGKMKFRSMNIVILMFSLFLFGINSNFVTVDAAINVDYVGPESSYDYYLWAGTTQYSRAEFDEPYGSVYWYVKAPGETGFGTLKDIDYGDGTSTVSTFSHTFNSGSTSGKGYEITAYVYPDPGAEDQSVDWDSYTLDVYTHPDEVITFPDQLTITDDIKIGDSYAFDVDVSSLSSNYLIDSIEVLVDGVSVATHDVGGVTDASISIFGSVPAYADDSMKVEAKIKGKLIRGLASLY